MPANHRRLHAIVSGHVQGVGYRDFVIRHAITLDLTGFVRNMPDGRVEAVAEGPDGALKDLLAELRRGPWGATVEDVAVEWLPAKDEFTTFGARR